MCIRDSLFTSCQSTREVQANYEVAQIEGTRICMDSTWDAHPDEKAAALLKPLSLIHIFFPTMDFPTIVLSLF